MDISEHLCADELVRVVRSAWERAVGGDVDDAVFGCVCENIAADILEDGIPESMDSAASRFAPYLLECSPVEATELSDFSNIVLDKVRSSVGAAEGSDEEDLLEPGMCEMCERTMKLTRHHLIPKAMHSRWKLKGYSKEHLNTCALLCRGCHSAVHHFYSEKELADKYFTMELLLQSEDVMRHAQWASKQLVKKNKLR